VGTGTGVAPYRPMLHDRELRARFGRTVLLYSDRYVKDLGYLDEDRYLFVVDRKKDVVISGGVNIYTKEIEAVLYQHPAVAEAAVIGLPDERWGEAVTAVVALKPGAAAAAGELIGWCREHLAGYKKPQAVHFMDVLPKNPSGKILKRELRSALA